MPSESSSPLERAAARNLVRNYLRVKPGENVIVESWSHTLPMASALVDEARQLGAGAFLAYEDDDAWWRAVERGQAGLLGRLSGPEWAALKAADVFVQFWGPADSARLEKLPEKSLEAWASGWFDRWYKTAKSTGLRGGRMSTGWVTDARVRHWGIRGEAWRKGLLEACLVDPKEMARSGRKLARALSGKKRVRITHPNGTDVEVGLSGGPRRVYEGCPHLQDPTFNQYDMLANFPDGHLLIALDSKTAEGTMVASRPSYDLTWFPWRRYLGGSFEFSGGRLTSFSFDQEEAAFAKRYAASSAGRDRTGFLVVGLNPRVKALPYLEERELGAVTLTVGNNLYPGGNNASDFYGALTLGGAEISVDGRPVVRGGRIL